MKKWVVAIAGLMMQLCLGGVYAWSVFVPHLQREFGYRSAPMQLVFGTELAVMTLLAIPAGRIQDRYGPRWLTLASALLTAAAYIGASFFAHQFVALWFCVGVLGGAGVAFGYLPCVATAVRWFPDRRGLASGLVVAGYGGAAVLLSLIAQALFSAGWSSTEVFKLVGVGYGMLMVVISRFVVLPDGIGGERAAGFRYAPLVRDRRFWALAVAIFAATYPGLSLIGNLKPIGLSFGFSEAVATSAIMVLAVGNGLGRVVWGSIYDRLGRKTISISMVVIALSVVGLACGVWSKAIFFAMVLFFGLSYGSGLAIMPARTSHVFGPELLGSVYPTILLAHGVAGIAGAPLEGLLYDRTGSHTAGLGIALAVAVAGWGLYLWLNHERTPKSAKSG